MYSIGRFHLSVPVDQCYRSLHQYFTNLGATWVSANMPNRYDVFENILLGYDKVEGYLKDTYYMGATVGRFANRIHQASFSIEGTTYLLEKNDGENTNHGGLSGFHKKIWQWKRTDSGIRFLLHSPDMEGGYPGNVQAEVEYQFTETNELTISYHGTTDRPTYLNLTNHAYFNLSGDKRKITEHEAHDTCCTNIRDNLTIYSYRTGTGCQRQSV